MPNISQHFVTFYSPGTFVPEESTRPISAWDPIIARNMAAVIVERHGAKPYAFRFTTRERGEHDLDSKVTKRSGLYYFGVRTLTLAEIRAANDPHDRILISNMECNGWDRVVRTTSGWKATMPLGADDVVLP